MNRKINKIQLLVELKGKGLVNYNGNKVPKRFKNEMYFNGKVTTNGSFAKENLYREIKIDENGVEKIIEIPKKIVSSNLIRKTICGDENLVNADKLINIPKLRTTLLSQDNVIVRGFTAIKNDNNLKRKSALTVTDAEQTSNTITWLETRTTEGERNDNSLFYKETCGDITYTSEIFFDIKQIQFISMDDNYDRMSLKETDAEDFIANINDRYGDGNATLGNWGTTRLNLIGEQGIVLSNKVVANCIRETIKRIIEINITRAGAYVKTSSIKIAIGHVGDNMDLIKNPKFVDIYNIDDYDKLIENKEIGVDFLPITPPLIEKIVKKIKNKE
jgi:hypothetical protein